MAVEKRLSQTEYTMVIIGACYMKRKDAASYEDVAIELATHIKMVTDGASTKLESILFKTDW
jgi:hypothetical protein